MTDSRDIDINATLDSFKDASESNSFKDRRNARKRIRAHLRAKHWNVDDSEQGDSGRVDPIQKPSLQFTWLAIERMHPKLFNGYSFEPEIVPESGRQYMIDPDGPLRQALNQVADPRKQESDANREAKLKTAVAQSLWEQAKCLDTLKMGSKGAIQYAEWWFLDGWEDNKPFLDSLHPDFIRKDPDAKSKEDSRFLAYFVERTIAELRERYPKHADQIRAVTVDQDKDRAQLPDDKVKSTLECWFVRDTRKKTVVDQEDIAVEMLDQFMADGYEVEQAHTSMAEPFVIDGMAFHPVTMEPVAEVPPQGFEVPIGYTVKRERQEPRYPGGWRHIKRVGNVIVQDGPNYTGNGELPLHWLPYDPTPGELDARGIPDHVQDINKLIDILYAEALKYVRTAMPGVITREGTLTEESAEFVETANGPNILKIHADEDIPVSQAYAQYMPPDLPQSYQIMIDRLINALEQVTGSYDLQGQNAAYDEISGEAVEQLETAANARNTAFRDRIRDVACSIVRNMLANAEKYSESPYAVDVQVGGATVDMEIDPQIFSTDEFERKFDVVIGSTDTLPQAGKARNEAIIESVMALQGLGPTMAPPIIEVLEIPEKATIEAALAQHFEQAAQSQPPDPMQIAQIEQQMAIDQKRQESVADGLQKWSETLAETQPVLALRALDYIESGKPISEFIEEITGLSAQKPSEVPMGAPPLQPGVIQ